jgi:hypothetical protein
LQRNEEHRLTRCAGGWFKIAEDAFDGTKWGVDRLIAAAGVQTITIPQCIAPGQYLLRGELIALHSASSSKGAQFYMVCGTISKTLNLNSRLGGRGKGEKVKIKWDGQG